MSRRRHSVDQIIGKLRQADVELGQGKTVEEACRALEITVQTYYRWRQKYGGMQPAMAKPVAKTGLEPVQPGPSAVRGTPPRER